MIELTVHGYLRSGSAYRVRIALNLTAIANRDAFHHLPTGEQHAPDYLSINPQGFVPALKLEGEVLTQSLAICEYLDEVHPTPPLLPADPVRRAKVRAVAQVSACNTPLLQNLKVLQRLRSAGMAEREVVGWAAKTIKDGLQACNRLTALEGAPFCFGDRVTSADICLVPQLVNAKRCGVDLCWPRLLAVERACLQLDAFTWAAPEISPTPASRLPARPSPLHASQDVFGPTGARLSHRFAEAS